LLSVDLQSVFFFGENAATEGKAGGVQCAGVMRFCPRYGLSDSATEPG